jgi:SCY1-like protein 1
MQLGAHKVPTAVASAVLAEEMASQGNENPWGNDDLIDINADEDDWSKCI